MDKDLEAIARTAGFAAAKRRLIADVRTAHRETLAIDAFAEAFTALHPSMRGVHNTAEIHEMYADYRLLCAGDREYRLHPNLVSRLSATTLARVPAEFVRLPFDTIKLTVPEGAVQFEVAGEPAQWARSIIISEMPPEHTEGKGFSRASPRTDARGVKIVLINPPNFSYFWIWLSKDEVHACVEDSIEFVRAQFSTEEKREMVRNVKREMLEVSGLPQEEVLAEIEHNLHFTDARAGFMRTQFEFILKCILYINGANADVYWHDESAQQQAALQRVKSNKKKRKLVQRAQSSAPHYRVGYKIILTRSEREMYKNVASGLWKVTSKFIVQGHFRQQPYGAKSALRKTIFIEPFYKGSEFSDEVTRQHIVK